VLTTAEIQREQLQNLLAQTILSEQVNLIAMHLTEIEEEAAHFLDQLIAFRAYARQNDPIAAQETLVEISLSLQHLAGHIQTVAPLLDEELGIGDND
jgi:hypothetical protein